MFENANLGPEILGNPAMIQYKTLQEIQSRLSGNGEIADPNNGVAAMWEFGSSVSAQMTQMILKKYEGLYKVRSQTFEELYEALSDYDYTKITASPASMKFQLIINKSWIVNNALPFTSDYNKIIIPQTTVISIGGVSFGLYYPIEITINVNTQVISVLYDTSTQNPLFTLSSNVLYDVSEYTNSGVELVSMVFDAYQFSRQRKTFSSDSSIGVLKSYTYSDSFNAVRAYTYLSGDWVELKYALSDKVYDPLTPTVILKPYADTQKLTVEIPKIYFTNGQVGNSFRLDIFTTQGQMTQTFTEDDIAECFIDFNYTDDAYAAPFSNEPSTLIIVPYNTATVTGGTDAITFTALRDAVVNNTLYSTVPVMDMELQAAAQKLGFTLTKSLDNVTNRIYYGSNTMTSTNGYIYPVCTVPVILNSTALNGNPNTILSYDAGNYTLLPTTVFLYTSGSNTAVPLSNDGLKRLASMTNAQLAEEMNNNATYLRQPFHITLNTINNTPYALAYNLMSPVVTNQSFIKENANSAAQFSITTMTVTHQSDGTGGYLLRMGVKVSSPMAQTPPANNLIILTTQTESSNTVYITATYEQTYNGLYVYSCTIPLSYQITPDNYLETKLSTTNGLEIYSNIPLTSTFNAYMCVSQSDFPNIVSDGSFDNLMPNAYQSTHTIVAQQQLTIQFGQSMASQININTDTTYGTSVYATYPATVYRTHLTDVYQRDAKGQLCFSTGKDASGNAILNTVKLFSQGDAVLSTAVQTVTTTGVSRANTAILYVSDTSQCLVGMPISGANITSQTTILQISQSTLTLSNVIVSDIPVGQTYTTGYAQSTHAVTAYDSTATSNQITLDSVENVYPGMAVKGLSFGSATDVSVTGINATNNTITLAGSVTAVTVGETLTFLNKNGAQSVLHSEGDLQLDGNGNPITVQERQNTYTLTTPLFDARLYASQNANDVTDVSNLPQTVTTTSQILDSLRNNLIERTYLFYRPSSTMGQVEFSTGDTSTLYLDAGLSFTVTYYVSDAVYANTALQSVISSTTKSVITSAIAGVSIINTDDIAATLKSYFSSSVATLNVGPINGQEGLQTLIVESDMVAPSVGLILKEQEDGTLSLDQNITIQFKKVST